MVSFWSMINEEYKKSAPLAHLGLSGGHQEHYPQVVQHAVIILLHDPNNEYCNPYLVPFIHLRVKL